MLKKIVQARFRKSEWTLSQIESIANQRSPFARIKSSQQKQMDSGEIIDTQDPQALAEGNIRQHLVSLLVSKLRDEASECRNDFLNRTRSVERASMCSKIRSERASSLTKSLLSHYLSAASVLGSVVLVPLPTLSLSGQPLPQPTSDRFKLFDQVYCE